MFELKVTFRFEDEEIPHMNPDDKVQMEWSAHFFVTELLEKNGVDINEHLDKIDWTITHKEG